MKKIVCVLMLFMVMAGPACAKILDIKPVETDSGLKFWFVADDHVPLVTVRFSTAGGAQHDPAGYEGLTELLSVMLDEGAGKHDSAAFQSALQQTGTRLSFSVSRDYFSGVFRAPVSHLDGAVPLFHDALNDPTFDDSAVSRMKDALLSALRFHESDPSWIAARQFFEKSFPLHPYGRPVEGTRDSIQKMTSDDLRAHKGRVLCREGLKIAVAGAVDVAAASTLVDRVFSEFPACQKRMTPFANSAIRGQTVAIDRDGAQTSIFMAQAGVARLDPDWWAARILDYALGGGDFSSRLMDDIRVKRGLTYGVASSLAPYDFAPLWVVHTHTPPDKAALAVDRVRAIWADVAKNGLSPDEIAAAKAYLVGSLPLALTSGNDIAAVLLQMQEDGLPIDTLDRRAHDIHNVSAADIARVAAARLRADDFVTIMVGPKGDAQ